MGWSSHSLCKLFYYSNDGKKSDIKVARVLSDWPDAGNGGYCPTIVNIPVEDQEIFNIYSIELLGTYLLQPVRHLFL